MTKSAWQRTGAFVGTVTAVALVAKTVSPRSSTRVIEAMGKSFSSSLGAMTGETLRAGRDNVTLAQYQKGGDGSIGYWKPDIKSGVSVWKPALPYVEPTPDIVIPKIYNRPLPIPYFWSGIYYRTLSLFPQVPTPFRLETWEQAACRIYDFHPETWDDAEYLAELVYQMKCECGTDGI
jgi:hypothetical protein